MSVDQRESMEDSSSDGGRMRENGSVGSSLDHVRMRENGSVGSSLGHVRMRVRRACDICKRRKVKCNGQQPCESCTKHRMECSYGSDVYARRVTAAVSALTAVSAVPEKPGFSGVPPPSAGGPCGYVSTAGASTAGASTIGASTDNASPSLQASPWQRYSLGKYRFHRRHHNLVPYYLGKALSASLPPALVRKHALRAPRLQYYGWNMSGGHYLKLGSSATHFHDTRSWRWDFTQDLQRGIVEKLATFFFQHVNRFVSIVHEQVFWQQFRSGLLNPGPKLGPTDLFEAILNLMVVIALRFTDTGATGDDRAAKNTVLTKDEVTWIDAQHHPRLEDALFEHAYTIVAHLSFEWESFELIQAWLLITVYLRTCHRQVSCWQALSRAVQMCNGMSLFLNKFPENSTAYDECRARNCYWTTFVLDRLVSFQTGRFPELAMPGPEMVSPDVAPDSWLSSESIALYKLAMLMTRCQKRYGQDLTILETNDMTAQLSQWFHENAPSLDYNHLCARQVFLTYLDVRIALEIRGLYQLLDLDGDIPPQVPTSAIPLNATSLIDLVSQILGHFESIVEEGKFFQPWWLNLSLLFTSSIICLTLIQGGLQLARARVLLEKSFKIWNYIEDARPPNPPEMAAECLWCLKMLNHMFCQRLKSCAKRLESSIGLDHVDDSVNDNKFRQFGKVERGSDANSSAPELDNSPFSQAHGEDNLLAHLQWFDQWLDVNNLETMF